MDSSDSSAPTSNSRSVIQRVFDWIATGIKVLFGLACLGAGFVGLAIAGGVLGGDLPYWALGMSLVSLGALTLGGTILVRLWTSEDDSSSAQKDPPPSTERERAAARDETPPSDDAPKRSSGEEPHLLSGIADLIGWAISGVVSLWFVAYVSAFLGGGVYLGYWALRMYRDEGFSLKVVLLGGGALLVLGLVGAFVLSWWRQRRESRHSYEKAPGAYRRAWSSPRMEATGCLPSVEVLGGFASTSIESWRNVLMWTILAWTAVVLLAVYTGWAAAFLAAPIAASGAFFALLLYRGARHRLRHGTAVFEMDTWPATMGDRLSGTVDTGVPLDDRPSDGFHVVLTCYERKGRSSYRTRWYAEDQVSGQPGPEGTLSLPVAFDLPDDEPPSTLERTSTRTIWRLEVQTDALDPPYHPYFDVPVFPADAPAKNHAAATERG